MKQLKTLGLAVVAAAALIALVGAGTASASVLCDEAPNGSGVCAAGHVKAAGTVVEAKLEAAAESVFASVWTEVKCNKSTIKAKTVNQGKAGERVLANVETLTFTECRCATGMTGSADVNTLNNGAVEFEATADNGNGKFYGQNQVLTMNCTTLGTSCKYGSPAAGLNLGTVTGGNPARLVANVSLNWVSGDGGSFLCGTTTKWEAAGYEVTTPNPLFLATS